MITLFPLTKPEVLDTAQSMGATWGWSTERQPWVEDAESLDDAIGQP
jgi:hypothetical protein